MNYNKLFFISSGCLASFALAVTGGAKPLVLIQDHFVTS